MSHFFRGVLAASLLCLCSLSARADGPMTLDQGYFIVFQGDQPVAREHFEYVRSGDSLVVTAVVERKIRDASGVEIKFEKTSQTVLSEFDFGMRTYLSKQTFEDHSTVKNVSTDDTTLTVSSEVDGAGGIDRIVRPAGRLYVMDPLVFSLFDIICRSLSPQSFTKRPIQLITLGATSTTTEATVSAAGADTVRWGGKRVVTRRFVMTDPGSRFTVWMDPKGRMLRLEHDGSGLSVVREQPAVVAPRKKAIARK
ncbi:MAG: hypothetical protein ABIU54_08940 [Candidatus Eisenbacteria bacterium]